MQSPIDVPEDCIKELGSTGLQGLLNSLLRIEAQIADLPVEALEITSNINARDGGIDALLDAGPLNHRFLPAGKSVWQSRSGQTPYTGVASEFEKPLVQEHLRDGGTYILVANRSLNSWERKDKETQLTAELHAQLPDANLRVLSAEQVSEWSTMHPATWPLVGHTLGGFVVSDEWLAGQPEHEPRFRPNPAREAIREELLSWVNDERGAVHKRLYGKPGVGKSRLALESFQGETPSAIYVEAPEYIAPGFLEGVRNRPGTRATLIVDECEPDAARHLENIVRTRDRRIRLLSVGHDRALDPRNEFPVDELSEEQIRAIVADVAPLPAAAEIWVARMSGGFVKLAREFALAVVQSPPGTALSDLDLQFLVGKLVPDEARLAMTALALLTQVGWEDDVAHEYDRLCTLLDADPADCRRAVQAIRSKGLVRRAGQYRYVTPQLLAVYLVAEEWQADPSAMKWIWDSLPVELLDRFAERLGQLRGTPAAERAVRETMSASGPFRTLDDLNDRQAAHLFSELAKTAPETALQTLRRIMHAATSSELHEFGLGRRDVVSALERLAGYRNHFVDASLLLLKLAAAENEDFANNATAVLAGLFNPVVGPTEATGDERLQFLRRSLDSSDAAESLVAVKGIAKALELFGTGPIVTDTGGMTPAAPWRVTTFAEQHEYRLRAFDLLSEAIRDDRDTVRSVALGVFFERFVVFFRMGLGDAALELANNLSIGPSERRLLWTNANRVLSLFRDDDVLTQGQKGRLEELRQGMFGDTLHDRFQQELSPLAVEIEQSDRRRGLDAAQERTARLEELATAAVAQPEELALHLDWLASDDAVFANGFAVQLAVLDAEGKWFTPFVEAAVASGNPSLPAGYLEGLARRSLTGSAEVEQILDEWALDPHLAPFVAPTTAALGLDARRTRRLQAMLQSGDVNAAHAGFAALAWSEPRPDLPLAVLVDLLRLLLTRSPPLESTVWTVAHRAYARVDRVDWHSDVAALDALLDLVTREARGTAGRRDALADHGWVSCAELLMPSHALAVAETILANAAASVRRLRFHSEMEELLLSCIRAQPQAVWSMIGQALEAADPRLAESLVEWAATATITDEIDVDVFRDWIDESDADRLERAKLVARITNVETTLSTLARWLIEEFGPDSSVANWLMSDAGVRMWSGSLADAEQGRLEAIGDWEEEDSAAISRFASRFRQSILEHIDAIDRSSDARLR